VLCKLGLCSVYLFAWKILISRLNLLAKRLLRETMNGKVIILMGSERDLEFSKKLSEYLKPFKLNFEFRVASAHKTPGKVLDILKQYEKDKVVYVTVAGKSNALSAFVDANTTKPVIACPPYSEKFGGADVVSSLRVPSGVGSLVTIEPEGAAIAAAKILAVDDKELEKRISLYQQSKKKELEMADESVRKLE